MNSEMFSFRAGPVFLCKRHAAMKNLCLKRSRSSFTGPHQPALFTFKKLHFYPLPCDPLISKTGHSRRMTRTGFVGADLVLRGQKFWFPANAASWTGKSSENWNPKKWALQAKISVSKSCADSRIQFWGCYSDARGRRYHVILRKFSQKTAETVSGGPGGEL